MSTPLDKLASALGRRDDVPNQQLARELVKTTDASGVAAVVAGLRDGAEAIRSDCVKVLYEIGYLAPDMIAPYAEDFLALLSSRHNRLVWGRMLALSTLAPLRADLLFERRHVIVAAIQTGSVITVDNGIKTLALVAAQSPAYNRELFPLLIDHLERCRAKDVPQHAESVLPAVTAANKASYIKVVELRMLNMPESRLHRLRRLLIAAGRR